MSCVVFADFDGVLNSSERAGSKSDIAHAQGALHLDDVLVGRLGTLLIRTGAELVISSSWRNCADLETIERALAASGLERLVSDKIPGVPGNLLSCSASVRSFEIMAWLDVHAHEVDAWVAIDDWDMRRWLGRRLVMTDPRVGLTEDDVERCVATCLVPWGPRF